MTHRQTGNWANRFDAEGLDGPRMKPGRGRHPCITEERKEHLKKDLSKSPETFGYNTATRSGPLLQKYPETAYGVVLQAFHGLCASA
ncbi:MAG: hypothetical protein LBE91_13265 [Tannerella sp.]|nr:hypothetical protein [Tannerella sp.]